MPHVDEGQLHAYLDRGPGDATVSELSAFQSHMAVCEDCRARLEEARRLRDRAAEILGKAGPPRIVVPPFEEMVRRAGERAGGRGSGGARAGGAGDTGAAAEIGPAGRDGGSGARRRSRGLLAGRAPLAWAATIMVALGAGWMARQVTLTSEYGQLARGPAAEAPSRPSEAGAESTDLEEADELKLDDLATVQRQNAATPEEEIAAAKPEPVPDLARRAGAVAPADGRVSNQAAADNADTARPELAGVAEQEAARPDDQAAAARGLEGADADRARRQPPNERVAGEDEINREPLALEARVAEPAVRPGAPAGVGGALAKQPADSVSAKGHPALGCYVLTTETPEAEPTAPELPGQIELLAALATDSNLETEAYFRDAIVGRAYGLRTRPKIEEASGYWRPFGADSVLVRIASDAGLLELRLQSIGGELVGVSRRMGVSVSEVDDGVSRPAQSVRGRRTDCSTLD